jgi:hypothetical protein
MKLARIRFNVCLCGRTCFDFVGLPRLDLLPFQAVERKGRVGRKCAFGRDQSRTQTLETSHTQPILLVYYDARPGIALGSLA